MAQINPLLKGYPEDPSPTSKKQMCIAGLLTTVYGLEELSQDNHEIVCLWLLHPRLLDQSSMEPVAYSTIAAWNKHLRAADKQSDLPGMIAVSLDQRNHGSREIDAIANQDWKSGNPNHAQDMFSIYHGTACDVSQLLTYLPSYLFPNSEHAIINNYVCGVSLGGHAAWHCLMLDQRITAAIVIIGCPDAISLFSDRARLTKLETAGARFVGSKDFPETLLEAVRSYDPTGQLIGIDSRRRERFIREPISDERATITPIMYKSFFGKKVLNMAGKEDRLVPYIYSEPFLSWLKKAVAPTGFFNDGNFQIEDLVFDNVGHELSPEMAKRLDNFLVARLQEYEVAEGKKPRL